MPPNERKRSKTDVLAEDGTLNQTPESVLDPKFQEGGFFDPHDAVQVKYEMLRRVSVEKASVTQISDEYGVSRPTFYQARADFEEGGIAGLVPRKRGPRGPHKIQGDVLAFLKSQFTPGEPIRAPPRTECLPLHPAIVDAASRATDIRNSWRFSGM
ncbi:helix-turn-helix domain-containing protein [Paraburkholderia sp. BR10882]|uniref:helix-turn-helix domain-containing protein n=1 Tax=unclassified Paraburkholderia TaxID=2615204 RepID=UPI0034CE011F